MSTAEYRNAGRRQCIRYFTWRRHVRRSIQCIPEKGCVPPNAYIDLGTWNWAITPFIGLASVARTILSPTLPISALHIRKRRHKQSLNFSWAPAAGLTYNVTQNFAVELAYRYLSTVGQR